MLLAADLADMLKASCSQRAVGGPTNNSGFSALIARLRAKRLELEVKGLASKE